MAALPEEVEEIVSRLEPGGGPGGSAASWIDGLRELRFGTLSGSSVAVAVTGDGGRSAARGAAAFLDAVPMRRLLAVGVAGGLVGDPRACTVLAGRLVWRRDGAPLKPAASLLEAASAAAGRTGIVATVDALLDTPEAKRSVARRLAGEGLDGDPAVADLESSHYASAAEERGLPWAVLRGVSDEADEALPSFLKGCLGRDGSVVRSRVVRHLFLHPGAVPEVLRLRRRVRCCAEGLADAVERILREVEP